MDFSHWKYSEKDYLECLEIQVLLGKETGIDESQITPGFRSRLSDCLQSFLKQEGIKILALHQQFIKDEQYNGTCREFHLSR